MTVASVSFLPDAAFFEPVRGELRLSGAFRFLWPDIDTILRVAKRGAEAGRRRRRRRTVLQSGACRAGANNDSQITAFVRFIELYIHKKYV